MKFLLWLIGVFNLIDLWATLALIQNYNFEEINIIPKLLMEESTGLFIAVKILVPTLILIFFNYAYKIRKEAKYFIIAAAIAYGLLAFYYFFIMLFLAQIY